MKKVWKAVIITAVSLVCAFVLCVAACKIQYSVYKSNNLETAKSVLLEYGIIDDNFLSAEDITKELFVVGFMRVIGMDDNAAESFDTLFLETTFGTRENDDAKEMKFYRFDYFRAWLMCYADYLRGYQTCYGDWLCESDGGIYPQLEVGALDAVKYIYGSLSESYDFFEAVNKIKITRLLSERDI